METGERARARGKLRAVRAVLAGLAVRVSDHGGWAATVTVDADGRVLDRRRLELVEPGLPSIPHHYDAQLVRLDEGVKLVERVRASAERLAAVRLDEVAMAAGGAVGSIALRRCPPLSETIAECLQDTFARNNADWVMYRKLLAAAAEARGWRVLWYDAKTVCEAAGRLLGADFERRFGELRKALGPPWGKDQKLAFASGIVAAWG